MTPDNKDTENEVKLSVRLGANEETPSSDSAPKTKAEEPAEPKKEQPSLSQIIEEHATEDDMQFTKNFTLSQIVGGDILSAAAIRRQIWLILLITLFIVLYITNRGRWSRSFAPKACRCAILSGL